MWLQAARRLRLQVEKSMNPQSSGLISIASNHSVDETVSRLTGILAAKGVKLFAVIDHSGEAKAAGI